jgi:hypothetical protein
MSTQVQYRRGSATQNNAFTGALGEITVDTTNWTLRVHDGATAGGGGNLATVAYVNAQIGSLSADSISNGTSNVKVVSSGGNVNITVGGSIVQTIASTGIFVTGNISATSNVIVGSSSNAQIYMNNANIHIDNNTSTGNVTIRANINGSGVAEQFKVLGTGGIGINGNIFNLGANGTGNIGTATGYFNTVFAKATSAQYADVAEKYVADQLYPAGTVLEIGGTAEVRATTKYATTGIAGVVSSHPALIMNSGETSSNAVEVALLGRVPCRVTGTIRRGDLLVASATSGVATALDPTLYQPGSVIGKALADYDSTTEGMIEVLVGRL